MPGLQDLRGSAAPAGTRSRARCRIGRRVMNLARDVAPAPVHSETLFATPEWFAIWSEAFGQGRFRIWRSSGGGVEVPHVRSWIEVAGLRVTSAYSAHNFYSPRYDIMRHNGATADLDQMMRDLDVACFTFFGVSERSALLDAFPEGRDASRVQREVFEGSPFVDCTLDWTSYWASRGKNLRSNIGGIEKRLRDTSIEFSTLSEWKEIEPILPTIYEIEASGWKGARGSAIAQDPVTRSFYDRLVREFSERGLIRLFVLKFDGEAVAFELNTLYRGLLTGLKGGFREEHARLSPGQLLRYRFLQWAFAQPDILGYDMQGPASETKQRWATGTEMLLTLRAFRRSARGWLCRTRLVTAPRIKAAVLGVVGPSVQREPA